MIYLSSRSIIFGAFRNCADKVKHNTAIIKNFYKLNNIGILDKLTYTYFNDSRYSKNFCSMSSNYYNLITTTTKRR